MPFCATYFLYCHPEELSSTYLEAIDTPAGYLVSSGNGMIFTDAVITETANWHRQTELAGEMAGDSGLALSYFAVGNTWGISLHYAGKQLSTAYDYDNPKMQEKITGTLIEIETELIIAFPTKIDSDELDAMLGGLLSGVISSDDVFNYLLLAIGASPDWIRWSWYEAVAENLNIDPDLEERVAPLGNAEI
jgi:hypothetical protein